MPLPIFPEDISETFAGGPNYNTSIVTKAGGKESRNRVWVRPRWEFDFSSTAIPIDEARRVAAFFHGARGRWLPWRLKDPGDFAVVDEPIGVGNGSTDFQALITYQDPDGWFPSYHRAINFIKPGTLVTKVNGVVAASTAAYDGDGTISFSSAPAGGATVTASFEFYVPVRFSVDKIDIDVLHADSATEGLARIRGLGAIEDHDPDVNLPVI